jgi:hypothetical protein
MEPFSELVGQRIADLQSNIPAIVVAKFKWSHRMVVPESPPTVEFSGATAPS